VVYALNSESVNLELIELTNFSCSVNENSEFPISEVKLTQSWLNLLIEMRPWYMDVPYLHTCHVNAYPFWSSSSLLWQQPNCHLIGDNHIGVYTTNCQNLIGD